MKVTWIIIGASGDLARRKLFPALAACARTYEIAIIAVDRKQADDAVPESLRAHVTWIVGDARDPMLYTRIAENVHTSQRFVYCATAPALFCAITCNALAAKLVDRSNSNSYIIYEKPYGTDYASAAALFDAAQKALDDYQIICVDHYLARSLVTTIETLRFANAFFRAFWCAEYIESIRIVLSESAPVHTPFYDAYGVLGDVMQSHLLQLLALTTMPEPRDASVACRVAAKRELFDHLRVVGICQGRYEGYEQDVKTDSPYSGSYAAIRFELDTPTWQGVRMYCEAGKGLAAKYTNIIIRLRAWRGAAPNECVITAVPEEGFLLTVSVKSPTGDTIVPLTLNGCYDCLAIAGSPAAYETLICDLMAGKGSGMVTPTEVLMQWKLIETARALGKDFYRYQRGGERPAAATKFFGNDL